MRRAGVGLGCSLRLRLCAQSAKLSIELRRPLAARGGWVVSALGEKGASAPPPQPDSHSRPHRAETPSPHHRAASRSRAADPVRAHARPRRTPSDSLQRAVSRSGAVDPLRATRPHTLKAQTANDRTPVCGQNPKEPRRRAAGAPGALNRRIGAPPPRALRRKARPARPASGPRPGVDPARGFPDTDRHRRVLRTRMSDRGPQAGGA